MSSFAPLGITKTEPKTPAFNAAYNARPVKTLLLTVSHAPWDTSTTPKPRNVHQNAPTAHITAQPKEHAELANGPARHVNPTRHARLATKKAN